MILILNHDSADPLADMNHHLSAIEERMLRRRLPVVIGVTHTDLQPDRPLSMYHEHLQSRGCKVCDVLPPVLEMDARDKKHVRATLIAMAALLEMSARFPKAPAPLRHAQN